MATETIQLESMEVAVPATLVAQVQATSSANPADISAAVGAAFRTIDDFRRRNGIAPAGPPRVIYTTWGADGVGFTAAVPVAQVPPNVSAEGDVSIKALPEATALRFVHRGPYHEVRHTYERIEAWLRERGGIKTPADWARYSPMWEEYLNDPVTTPESELITRIYLTLP
jgi:effector-binding domain-containing protein